MAETIVAPVAAPTPASGTGQPASGSPSPSPSKFDFDNEPGPGPNLLADELANSTVPATERPASTGERSGTDLPATTPAKAEEADPVKGVLDYYTKLEAGKLGEAEQTGTEQQPETAQTVDAFKAIDANREKIISALRQSGLDDTAVEQFNNYHKMVGQHSAELGQLRKERESVIQNASVLREVVDVDEQGKPVGFNGLKLLKMATDKFGKDEVLKQLATIGLKIVPVNFQPASTDDADATAENQVVGEIAKQYGIETENLSPEEVRNMIDADPKARAAFTRRLARLEAERVQQGDRQTAEVAAKREADVQAVRETLDQLAATVPHFATLEPVMTKLYQQYFKAGQPSNSDLTKVLHLAAEGQTLGSRLPKLFEAVRQAERKAVLKRLGIPESEYNTEPTKVVVAPKKPVSVFPEGEEDYEHGPNLLE